MSWKEVYDVGVNSTCYVCRQSFKSHGDILCGRQDCEFAWQNGLKRKGE